MNKSEMLKEILNHLNSDEVEEGVEEAINQYKEQLTAGTDPLAIVQDIVDHQNYNGVFDDYVVTKAGLFYEINTIFNISDGSDSLECLEWVQFILSDIDLNQEVFLISSGKPVNVTKERVEDLIYHFVF